MASFNSQAQHLIHWESLLKSSQCRSFSEVHSASPRRAGKLLSHLFVPRTTGPDKKESNSALKREWKKYDGSGLLSTLTPLITSLMSSDLSAYTVQDMWNCLEDILVSSIDLHAPLTTTPKPTKSKPLMLNPLIKMKLNNIFYQLNNDCDYESPIREKQ